MTSKTRLGWRILLLQFAGETVLADTLFFCSIGYGGGYLW